MLDALFNFDLFTLAFVILGLLFLLKLVYVPNNGPPGPRGYPLVGNFPLFLSGSKTKLFEQLRQCYGDVFSLQLGSKRMVVINGYETLKEAFVKRADVFSDRPVDDLISKRSHNCKGIVRSSGNLWKQTRAFSLQALREFGFGKRSLETKILEEVSVFLDIIGGKCGDAFSLGKIAQISVSNIICSISFGERYAHEDKTFKELMLMIDDHVMLLTKSAITNFFPVLRYLPGDVTHIEEMSRNYDNIKSAMQQQIDRHRATFQSGNIRDLIDAFIEEEIKRGKNEYLEDANLLIVLSNLFVAGTETTATTIKWAILFLLHNACVQKKLRDEITEVIGSSRLPSMTDKPKMVYTDAFIHETLRMGNLVPLSLLHGVKHDTDFKGYKIRKDDLVVPNLDSALFDETLFTDPHTFNPERFIGEDGQLNGKERTVLAFSLGRRVCFGESLARMELFLFLTSLIQRFKLLPADDENLPTLEPISGVVNYPQDFKIKAVKIT
ncbi:cytochrome P450 2J6-like [Ylistrum balloti]|uniref:cytochrome P450 2J6-like n=1 Tax=Ylistrum balloti TaxID=509963 RepID=UPI002905C17D|nr:cytochrome P450 2J6-like [Ylistrum balloti]